MPPHVPGTCRYPNCHLVVESGDLCWWHAEQARAKAEPSLIVEPPLDDEDTQPVPAQPAPPRRESLGRTAVVECHPCHASWMLEAGYRLVREMTDPASFQVVKQVWVRDTDEGC